MNWLTTSLKRVGFSRNIRWEPQSLASKVTCVAPGIWSQIHR